MNQFNTSNGEDQKKYRRLKHFWKRYSRKKRISLTLSISATSYSDRPLSQSAIVSKMLAYDSELKATYDVYQQIIQAVGTNDYNKFSRLLDQAYHPNLSSYMKTSLRTLRKLFFLFDKVSCGACCN